MLELPDHCDTFCLMFDCYVLFEVYVLFAYSTVYLVLDYIRLCIHEATYRF